MNNIRTYQRAESVVFLKTREAYGGFSNMAGGYPLELHGIAILSSEALYQACRFPDLPQVQQLILQERSPISAKRVSQSFTAQTRADWSQVRVKVMRWCLGIKLAQNWERFGDLLESTDAKAIVEESYKDAFWGAKPRDKEVLVGTNALGRLLMELREGLRSRGTALKDVAPLEIPNFKFLEQGVER